MEANTPPDLVKQPLVMERREKSARKELMEEVGRIETFRLEEAFLNACRDGNLPVVRLCLEHRVNVNCNHGWGLRRAIRHHRQEVWEAIVSSPGVAISSANSHGMTALHTAARYLRSLDIFLDFSRFGVPEAVTLLLRQPGILVNSRTIQVKSLIVGDDSCARARLLSWWEPSTAMLRL